MTQVQNLQSITSNPKFTVRYTLGLFLLSNWLYNTLITGEDGLADFSKISNEVFNDKMFYVGAYQQMCGLVADINDERVVNEMMLSKTFLLDRKKLKEMSKLDENKMKELAEQGISVYSILLTKKLAENVIFDEDVVPTSYTCIDGSDKNATDTSIPLSLVFSVDSDMLEKVGRILDMDDKTIVQDCITEFSQDDKMGCFKNTFNFLKLIDGK